MVTKNQTLKELYKEAGMQPPTDINPSPPATPTPQEAPKVSRAKGDFKPVRQIISEYLETQLELKIAESVARFGQGDNLNEIKQLQQALNPQLQQQVSNGMDDAERVLEMAQRLKDMQGEPKEMIETGDATTDLLQELLPLLKPLIERKLAPAPAAVAPPSVIP